MNPQRILLPIDVAKCPLEVFEMVNGFARSPGVTAILLHVLELNIFASENRVYEELGYEAAVHLGRLARAHLHPRITIVIHVRRGRLAEEILAEARVAQADLIVLPAGRPSFWKRHVASTVEEVTRNAPCAVLVPNMKTLFDCHQAWGHQVRAVNAALAHPHATSEVISGEETVWIRCIL
jgi:nucleotide-binding universal stress UspA family protein